MSTNRCGKGVVPALEQRGQERERARPNGPEYLGGLTTGAVKPRSKINKTSSKANRKLTMKWRRGRATTGAVERKIENIR
eukprot:855340-Amphidinium_carterae.4